MKSTTLAILACSAFGAISGQAATVLLDNTTGGLGELLDNLDADDIGTPASTITVPGFTGLTIEFLSIATTAVGTGSDLNSTAASFGINSAGTDDTDAFDADLSEIATFSFNQDVEITTIDFATFTVGEAFNFGGQSITFSDNISTIYTFSTPLAIAANTSFSMQATTGTIGIESFEVTAVPEPSTALLGAIGALALLRRRR